ncbi:MAG: hypothetical protein ACLFUB_20585, partial [Cyclobacteriaceae bacterium]
MVNKINSAILFLLVFLLALAACEDDTQNPETDTETLDCSQLQYEDTIFYLRDQAADYIVSPLNTLQGTFGASPEGLAIDPASGDINVSQSETGLRYEVYFTPENSTDTCRTIITISGIDYENRVYRLDLDETQAVPIYNGVREASLPCSDDDDDD